MNGITQPKESPLTLGFLIAAICAFLFVVGLSFQSTFESLHTIWTQNNETYSHGYILIIFVFYVLYVERQRFSLNPSVFAIPMGVGIGAIWLASDAVQVQLIQQMLIPVILAALLVATIGFRQTIKTWVPIVGLYLAIPIMDVFLNPLQDLTTWAVTQGVRAAGITAYIEQYDIHIPYGTLRIADGCAGLNYMLAGLSVGLFYAFLNLRRKRDIALGIGLMIILSLVGNWIRVFALVMIAYDSQMQSSLVDDHGFFGWVIFAILIIGYFFFMEFYSRKVDKTVKVSADKPRSTSYFERVRAAVLVSLTGLGIAIFPFLGQNPVAGEQYVANVIQIPQTENALASFQLNDDASLQQWGAKYVGSDAVQFYSTTLEDGSRATLLVASYFTQQQGKELVYYANKPARGITQKRTFSLDKGQVNVALALNERVQVFWFNRVGDSNAIGSFETKVLQLKQAFAPKPASAIVLYVECDGTCDADLSFDEQIKTLLNKLLN